MLTLFDKMDSHSVEGAVKKIVETNIEDEAFLEECRIWAQSNGMDMPESVEESSRVNTMLFDIITSTTRITKERLSQISEQKKDWFFNAEEALELGVITEIID